MKLCVLLEALSPKASKWYSIGLQLGLSADELDTIEADSKGVEQCLRKVLQKWHTKTPHPTWEVVIAALRSPLVGEPALAKKLEDCPVDQIASESSSSKEELRRGNQGKIKASFAKLVKKVTSKLESRDIDVKEFRLYICNLFENIEFTNVDKHTVTGVMEAVSHHPQWGYSCSISIEEISENFGGDNVIELKGWISDYKAELAGFNATTKIVDYIKMCNEDEEIADSSQSQSNMAKYDHKYCRRLAVKLESTSRVTEKSLDYIDQLWRSIAVNFLLPPLSALLDNIKEGCVEVTWLVPTESALQIQGKIQESIEFLKKAEVTKLILDNNMVIYEEKKSQSRELAMQESVDRDDQLSMCFKEDISTTMPISHSWYTPANQARISCLGRPFGLGMLYDSRSEEIVHGVTLWDDKKMKSAIYATKNHTYGYRIITEDTIQEKSSSLNLTPDLELSVMAGIVDIKGAAEYLHDRKSSEKQCRVTLQYKSTTHCDSLIVNELGEIQYPQVFSDYKPTHVVTAIDYGADAFLVFDRSVSEGEALDRVSGGMEAAVKEIPLLVSASARHGVNKKELDQFLCKVYGDFLPESNPITFDDALKFSKELPAILKKNTIPKIAHLMPLTCLVGKKYNIEQVIPISPQLIPQVEEIMEYFHSTEVRASDLRKHEVCHKFVDINEQLLKFLKLLIRFKADFTEKLSETLLKIRSEAAVELRLTKLISSVKESLFSPTMTDNYLKGKEKEIKLLAQHLKNMEKNSKIQFDFPDTECNLTTLTNDDKFDHVISFAFNVTSKTSAYLESLESFIETGATNSAEGKEWFDEPDLVKQLSTEIDKFMKFSSPTKKTIFVVTSTKADKFNPSMSVYNRARGSSTSDLTTPPQASKVTDTIMVTPANQLRISCLGRPFGLGMLYDSRSEKIIHGVTLWDNKKMIYTTKKHTYDSQIITEDTIQEKLSSLNITADMKLSVMAGMVDVKGAAEYLHDRKTSEKQCRVTLQYKCTTHCVSVSELCGVPSTRIKSHSDNN